MKASVVIMESHESILRPPNRELLPYIINILADCSVVNFVGLFKLPEYYENLVEQISLFDNRVPISVDIILANDESAHYGRYEEDTLLNESVPYAASPFRAFKPKYFKGGCTLHSIFVDVAVNPRFSFYQVLRAMVMAREDPTFVILFNYQATVELHKDYEFLEAIRSNFLLDLTSKFIICSRTQAFLQCMHCVPLFSWYPLDRLLSLVPLKEINSIADLYSTWKSLHKNLKFLHVHNRLNFFWSYTLCTNLHGLKGVVPEDCAFRSASSHLNFSATPQPYPSGQVPYGQATTYSISSLGFIHDRFFKRSRFYQRESLLSVPLFYDLHQHVLFVQPMSHSQDFLVLIRPFTSATWLGLLASFLCTIISLSLLSPNIFGNSLWTIGSLFQQSINVHINRQVIIMSTWLITTLIITNFYSGALSSFMTIDSIPQNLPETLRQLLNLNFFVGSMAYHKPHGYRQSLFKDIVLPPLMNSSGESSTYFRSLAKSTHFLNETNKFELVRKIAGSIDVATDSGAIKVPKPFAILSTESDLWIVTELIRLTTSFVPVPGRESSTPFISRKAWIASRNFVLPLFENVLKRVVEGGFYERWTKMWRMEYYARELNRPKKYLQGTYKPNASDDSFLENAHNSRDFMQLMKIGNVLSYLVQGSKKSLLVEPKPLTMESTAVIFVINASALVACISLFLIEIWRKFQLDWRNRQTFYEFN